MKIIILQTKVQFLKSLKLLFCDGIRSIEFYYLMEMQLLSFFVNRFYVQTVLNGILLTKFR